MILPTLQCLLTQTVAADRIILWVSAADRPNVPSQVEALARTGRLSVMVTKDLGPFTKIIPTLRLFPAAYIATADDDVYYPSNWLSRLTGAIEDEKPRIICHRAHGVRYDSIGAILPYEKWDLEANSFASTSIFPTGVGGVLYSPGSLGKQALDEEAFLALTPKNDDIWLAWMGHRAGASYTKLTNRRSVIDWPNSQEDGLFLSNLVAGRNDVQIANMVARFGPLEPPDLVSRRPPVLVI